MDNDIGSTDFARKRPEETDEQWRERVVSANRAEFDNRLNNIKNDTSTEFNFSATILQTQVEDMIKEIYENFGDEDDPRSVTSEFKEKMEFNYSYLLEKTPTFHRKILEKRFSDVTKEIRIMLFFINKVETGELSKFDMHQAYSMYRMKRVEKETAGIEHIRRDDAWDLLRSKNAWGDKNIYYSSSDDESEDGSVEDFLIGGPFE